MSSKKTTPVLNIILVKGKEVFIQDLAVKFKDHCKWGRKFYNSITYNKAKQRFIINERVMASVRKIIGGVFKL